jgi:hypothetical protein
MSRVVCVALAACLLMASSGCIPSHEVAAEKAGQVRVGMTRAEVVQTLGEPETRIYKLPEDAQEVWIYWYGQGLDPDPWNVVVGIVAILGIVIATSNGGGLHSFGPSEFSENFGVRVLFNAEDGVVQQVYVTPPQ